MEWHRLLKTGSFLFGFNQSFSLYLAFRVYLYCQAGKNRYICNMCTAALQGKKKHVLLIDDDEDEKDIFELAAAKCDLPIELDHVKECDQKKLASLTKPDFIFLDINMPNHDGFLWLKGIREKVAEPIPVIMYSTTRNPEKVQQAYQLGASLFVTKPDTSAKLSRILQEVFQLDWSDPVRLAEKSFANNNFHLIY